MATRLFELTPLKQRRMYMHLFENPYYIWLRPGTKLSGFVTKQLWEMLGQEPEPDIPSDNEELRQ